MKAIAIGLIAAVLSSCGSRPMPVQLQGDPVSIAWLAGSWTGEYWAGAGGRHGTLNFDLASGTDTLYGDVRMIDPSGRLILPADPGATHRVHVLSPQSLRIDFVRATGNTVHGVLEPYRAPDCDCVVTTSFVGQVHGDEITGTFETRGGGAIQQTGLWRMTRIATTRP